LLFKNEFVNYDISTENLKLFDGYLTSQTSLIVSQLEFLEQSSSEIVGMFAAYNAPQCTDKRENFTFLNITCNSAARGSTQGGLSSSLAYSFSALNELQKEISNPTNVTQIQSYINMVSTVR
jgi:hypothetical protein